MLGQLEGVSMNTTSLTQKGQKIMGLNSGKLKEENTMITRSNHYKYALRATALMAQFVAGMLVGASSASANPQCYPLTASNGAPVEEVEIRVTGKNGTLAGALGFGAHFSTVGTENGFGGAHSECHLLFTSSNTVQCYDGVKAYGSSGAQNSFIMNVGEKQNANNPPLPLLRDVTFFVKRREVKVRATRISRGPTKEVVPYVVEASFPMRDYSYYLPGANTTALSSGFWDPNKQICIEGDGYSTTIPPASDVLATANAFPGGFGTPGTGLSPLQFLNSNGVFNNNTTTCTSPSAANRCGQGFLVNVIMKQ